MQELRTDDLTGAQVVVAPGRATRPEVFRGTVSGRASGAPPPASCPFCAGHESMTPPEVARKGPGAPDTPGWQVRVVPNLYPIVGGAPAGEEKDGEAGGGVPGAHEVVVLSPAHELELDELPLDGAAAAVAMLRDRAAHHLDAGFAHAQPMINHGRASGASIEHPHAQLVALSFLPPLVDRVLDRFAAAGRDLVADEIDRARTGGLLVRDAAAVTWCPRASFAPFLMRVALPYGRQRFDRSTDDEVRALTAALQDALARLRALLGGVAYNVVVHTGPRHDARPFHWWVDVVPRLTVPGGFELGTGVWVNTAEPETAAADLRGAGP